jgi:TonB family protein
MNRYFRKRIGQSGADLTTAVVFSFFLHILVGLAAIFLYIKSAPKVHVPLFYQVMLVSQPADLAEPPPSEEAPPQQKQEPKQKQAKTPQKAKKAALKAEKTVSKKDTLPEFSEKKSKPTPEQEKPEEKSGEQQKAAASGPVAVTASQQDFKFAWYLALVREKIGQNWRPPPDMKDARAKVLFTVNRSGWVDDVNLDAEHSNGTFGFKQAAIRAIRSSNPFPPLPEEFSKLSVEFSVDLMAEQ